MHVDVIVASESEKSFILLQTGEFCSRQCVIRNPIEGIDYA